MMEPAEHHHHQHQHHHHHHHQQQHPPASGTDEKARRRIVESLNETLFVEAGAGTGKTTQLVSRIVALVVHGYARIENIAAITFTEAAASELSDRISESLEKLAAWEVGTGDPLEAVVDGIEGTEQDRARERAISALDSFGEAAVTTLHGFSRRILSEHSFEAGLPPVFEVFDELRSEAEFDRRWDSFVNRILDDQLLEQSLVRATICGITVDNLRTIARNFDAHQDLLLDIEIPRLPEHRISGDEVLDALDQAASLASYCSDGEDILYRHVTGLSGFRERLRSAAGDIEVLMLLAGASRLTSSRGRRQNWSGKVEEVRDALARAEQARSTLLGWVGRGALAMCMDSIRRFTLESAAERRLEGQLCFHDLLVQARDLVRRSAEVRSHLHDQYRYLLVDEFQDTDPIQAELATRIAAGVVEPEGGRWWELEPEPGRLFFVGDPKQSIYRFRRADISLYLATRERFPSGSEYLVRNHRSVPGVLRWVNAVFDQLIGEGDGDGQPAYVGLGEYRGPQEEGAPVAQARPPVVLLGGPSSGNLETIRREEAADIASAILRAKQEGWKVGESARPARLEDICILIPSRTSLATLEDGLEHAGIPYRLEASNLVYSSSEVAELLLVLRAVDDPGDQIAVVGALRAGIFGCGDDDLLRFRIAGGSWDYRSACPPGLGPDDPVVAAMVRMRDMHEQRFWREPSQLIEELLRGRRLLTAALDEHRFRTRWRQLRFVADQARWYSEAVGGTLRDYLAWAGLQSEEGVRVDEAVLPESDDDAVRIMTIHKSKGLEFPIVVVAGLNARSQIPRAPRVLWGPDGPEVRVNQQVLTTGFDALAQREELFDRYERTRLLYVAATRARDHLVLSLHHKPGTTCQAAELTRICDLIPDQCHRLGNPDPARASNSTTPTPGGSTGEVDGVDERARWIAERSRRLEGSGLPSVLSATAIAGMLQSRGTLMALDTGGQGGPEGAEEGVDAVPWRRGRSGTAIGRAVHGVLQMVDLATGAGIESLSASQSLVEGVGTQSAEVERLARAALECDLIRDAMASRYWREVYVGAPVGNRSVEGFIDLLIEEEGGYHIVDYKTGAGWDGGDLDRAVARYRPQGAAYALAVEAALRRPVNRCTFLFVSGGGKAVARHIEDLPAAMEEVRLLLAAGPPRLSC